MKLYRIYVPKFFNDTLPIPPALLLKITAPIRDKFGGYSLDPFGRLPIIQGVWENKDGKKFEEEMNVMELFVEDTFDNKRWMKYQKEIWRQELQQEEFFIIVQDAEVIAD